MSEQVHSDSLLYRLRQRAARSALIPCGEMVRITPEQCLALVECAEAAQALLNGGLRNNGERLYVIEKKDKSDPHYRLCNALEKLEAL